MRNINNLRYVDNTTLIAESEELKNLLMKVKEESEKVGLRMWKQPRYPSADEWIRKLWYMYTMEYYSAVKKNAFESVLMRWMKLDPIIQNEVSQKEKHQYSVLTHIYGILKDGNDDPICETARDTDVKNRLLDSVGEGEGGMI